MKRSHVVGLGESGLASIYLLLKEGWQVIASDDSEQEELRDLTGKLKIVNVRAYTGGHSEALKESVDLVTVSPGVPWDADVLAVRRSQDVEVIGEIELGSRYCQGRIAAITGSNGKTTTTKLLGDIFSASGRPNKTCGNIGLPFTEVAAETRAETLISLEVSSFQLEGIVNFRPEIAVMLNLSPDHLDRHGSLGEYAKIKSRIWMNQTDDDWLIYFHDDPEIVKLSEAAPSQRFPFSVKDNLEVGASLVDDRLQVITSCGDKFTINRDCLKIPGTHNSANALAAISAAMLMGIDVDVIRETIEMFEGVPHRLELIREDKGIRWINDSKATNVDAGRWALESVEQPIILIAGGRTKGGGFQSLQDSVKENVKTLILIGEAADEIKRDLGDQTTVIMAGDIETAVIKAHDAASSGDTVLLAPLCSSFDQFSNFEERGDRFRELVTEL